MLRLGALLVLLAAVSSVAATGCLQSIDPETYQLNCANNTCTLDGKPYDNMPEEEEDEEDSSAPKLETHFNQIHSSNATGEIIPMKSHKRPSNKCRRSPIDISTRNTRRWEDAPPLHFSPYHWDPFCHFALNNTGQTCVYTSYHPAKPLKIWGGPLAGSYKFVNMHCHWDNSGDHAGTEHSIDGEKGAMEIHLMYYSTKYRNVREAMTKPRGLAVCSFRCETKKNIYNEEFERLAYAASKVRECGSAILCSFNCLQAIRNSAASGCYWTYEGTETDAKKFEVTWIIHKNEIIIGKSQMDAFRKLKDCQGNIIANNIASLEPLCKREVFSVGKHSYYED